MIRVSSFRPYARTIALLLLLTGPAGFQHSGKDDFACVPGGSTTDGDALAAAPSDIADHCLVCHWTRSLRSHSATFARTHWALAAAGGVDVSQPVAHRAPALDRAPARAPPLPL
jgi:hypothetical protein